MRRRKRQGGPPARAGFRHQPFRDLARSPIGRRHAPRPQLTPSTEPRPAPPPSISDEELFRGEMADVTPLPAEQRQVIPRLAPKGHKPIVDPDAEVIDELERLVSGAGSFDIANTTDYIEGAVVDMDRRLVRRLRNGEFAYQSHLDLHGLNSEEARGAVDRFLAEAYRRGHRCVLIVHGRGLNSKDQFPVLKHRLTGWLSRTAAARLVLAFASARPCDGGVGALYVLLRRRPAAKRPIQVTAGAKW